jgi:hypothetical protein
MHTRSIGRLLSAFLPALVLALVVLSMSTASFAQIGIAISIGPPPIPVYEQPLCPEDGYLWVPGYWAYDYDISDYYWVPGTWVMAPEVGFLWTPGYWGWEGGRYRFWDGYWGPHIGFYGGINYGFGYFGSGFEGGRWDGGHFFYNRAVMNINVTEIHNVYNTTVINTTVNHVSYNGGNGGIDRRPRPEEEAAARERHLPPVAAQTQHVQAARSNPQLRASMNMGKPPVAATARPGEFNGRGVVPAREAGGSYTPPANRGGNKGRAENRPENNVARPSNPVHPHDLSPMPRPGAPNTGNPKRDQKYQQQQEKVFAKQQQERDRLQQKQEQEHQRLTQQNANEARKQQVEQRQQKHEQQQQQLQQKVQQSSRERSKPPR